MQRAKSLLQGVPDEAAHALTASPGTQVTSVIAAQPNGWRFLGVAWGARVKVFTAPIGNSYPWDIYA